MVSTAAKTWPLSDTNISLPAESHWSNVCLQFNEVHSHLCLLMRCWDPFGFMASPGLSQVGMQSEELSIEAGGAASVQHTNSLCVRV